MRDFPTFKKHPTQVSRILKGRLPALSGTPIILKSRVQIKCRTGIHELTLEFTTVTNVQSIRLDVYEKRDPSIILREIIPGFIGNF